MTNFFTVNQVAVILKLHPLTIRRFIRENKLAAIKVAGAVRIREENFVNFQKTYNSKSPSLASKSKLKAFTGKDPLWKIAGRSSSISFPTDPWR